MTPETISPQNFGGSQRRMMPKAASGRRVLVIAAVLSVCIHLLPVGLLVFLPRAAPIKADPENQGTVELLMVEQKGAEPKQPRQPDADRPATEPQPPQTPAASPPGPKDTPLAEAAPESRPVPPPPSPDPAPQSRVEPPQPEPVQKSKGDLVFDFAGTDSESNAEVVAGRVLPAMPDDKFRNRPPVYPAEAEMLGQTGAVLVIIHVSAYGVATGADVAESSGSASLDRAALTAVRKWRFHPAMKEGLAVPFDMPFRFVFSAN